MRAADTMGGGIAHRQNSSKIHSKSRLISGKLIPLTLAHMTAYLVACYTGKYTWLHKQLVLQHVSRNLKCWDRRGRHRMIVGFTTTCAISAHRNLTDHHDIAEILLKVVLNTINQPTNHKMFPETLQEHCRNIPETLQKHCRNIAGTFQKHCRNIAGTLQKHCRNIAGTFQKHCRNIAGTFQCLCFF